MKWVVIGISGPTCSGKTTLAKKLNQNMEDSVLIDQDDYYLPANDPRQKVIPEMDQVDWDVLSSLDMPKMYSNILSIIKSVGEDIQETETEQKIRLLIIEGLLIFNYKPIADLCNKKYFINLSQEVSEERRKSRVYKSPDAPGYFDKVVWPEYLRHLSELSANMKLYNSITFLDGSRTLDELYNEIIHEVKQLLH